MHDYKMFIENALAKQHTCSLILTAFVMIILLIIYYIMVLLKVFFYISCLGVYLCYVLQAVQ